MKVEYRKNKKSHYYSQGDSIITRAIETKSGLLPFVQYHPMVSHEVEDVVSYIFEHSGHQCHVIEDGIYFEVPPNGKFRNLFLNAIGIELPQDRAEEVCEMFKTVDGL